MVAEGNAGPGGPAGPSAAPPVQQQPADEDEEPMKIVRNYQRQDQR